MYLPQLFHALENFVTDPSSTAAGEGRNGFGLVRALILMAAAAIAVLMIWLLLLSQSDPFIKATLKLQGSPPNGEKLFRMNCAGCHGISGQGLVGPSLNEVSYHKSDAKLIQQVVSGRTPPMPSFQMEPQAMSDLLSYLHSLN